MSGRKGYDLSNLCMETRPRARGPVQLHVQKEPTASGSTDASFISQSSFLSNSFVSSSFNNTMNTCSDDSISTVNSSNIDNEHPTHPPTINSHSPLEQCHVSSERPQQPLRLSPGYIKTSGQYMLYNQQTGRGWRRTGRSADDTPNLTSHNLTRSHHESVATRCQEMDMTIGSDAITLGHPHHIADTLDLSTPLAGHKIEASNSTGDSASQIIKFDVDSHINFDINPAVTVAVNNSIHTNLEHTKDIAIAFSIHHNTRARPRYERQARRVGKKVLRCTPQRSATSSPTIVGGYLAPPFISPSPAHSCLPRLPKRPISSTINSTTSIALNKDTADSCFDSQSWPKSTPQITLTAPSDDEN